MENSRTWDPAQRPLQRKYRLFFLNSFDYSPFTQQLVVKESYRLRRIDCHCGLHRFDAVEFAPMGKPVALYRSRTRYDACPLHNLIPAHDMTRKKEKGKEQSIEVRIEIDGLTVVATSGKHSADFDRLLNQHDAESFVFIPLAKPGKHRRLISNPAAMARKKARLPAGEWHDGELQRQNDDNPVPGALAFNIRRHKARAIAATLGVTTFLWGTSGAPVERHAVRIFEKAKGQDWKTVQRLAFKGLSDMLSSLRNIATLPTAVQESQTSMQRFWQLVAVVLGLAATAGAVQALALALLGANGSTAWLTTAIRILFYPFVIPAVLVGTYLRVLVRKGEQGSRDFTTAEAEDNWHTVAPHLLALWMLCWIAVLLLSVVQSVPGTVFPFLGRTSDITVSFIVCVWMLLPIANSKNIETLVRSGFETAIAAAVSIFVIKLSLYLTNMVTDVLWGIVIRMMPFDIPERLQQIINIFINVGAEVFFVAVLLGYAWTRTRQQFMRL